MVKYGIMICAVFVVALTFQEGSALRCWRCSSDATNAAFCDDPFDQSIITEQQRRWSFVDCSYPNSQQNPYNAPQSRPVCKKMKQKINEKTIISRSCAWEDINAAPDSCINANTPGYIKTEFCETCTFDGCNGASTFGPATMLVLVPAVVAKLLAW